MSRLKDKLVQRTDVVTATWPKFAFEDQLLRTQAIEYDLSALGIKAIKAFEFDCRRRTANAKVQRTEPPPSQAG